MTELFLFHIAQYEIIRRNIVSEDAAFEIRLGGQQMPSVFPRHIYGFFICLGKKNQMPKQLNSWE